MNIFFIYYLIMINTITLILFGLDKLLAKRHLYRISEKMLFTLSLLYGSLGGLIGMYLFKHKTKHLKFIITMPILLVLQIIIVYYLYTKIGA